MPAAFASMSASDEPCFARTLTCTQSFVFRSVYEPTLGMPWLQTSTSLPVPRVKIWFCDWPSMAFSAAWLPPSTVIVTGGEVAVTTSPRNWNSCRLPPGPAEAVAATAAHMSAARPMVRVRRCFMVGVPPGGAFGLTIRRCACTDKVLLRPRKTDAKRQTALKGCGQAAILGIETRAIVENG